MFDTTEDLERSWRHVAGRRPHREAGTLERPADGRERQMEGEILAVLCPDWRNAMLVVDPHSLAVAYANTQALRMFKRRYPIYVAGGILEVAPPDGNRRLRGTLDGLLTNGPEAASLVADDPDQGFTCAIRVRLLQGFLRQILERHLQAPGRLAVLEVATGRLGMSSVALHALGAAFQLTTAELSVLSQLVDGRSLGEIAVMRRVQLETVRNQCKRLLGKTRCRRQSELVRLVLALCAHDAFVLHD